MNEVVKFVLGIMAAVIIVFTIVNFAIALGNALETGPGCPADPEWLGFCHTIDNQ